MKGYLLLKIGSVDHKFAIDLRLLDVTDGTDVDVTLSKTSNKHRIFFF